MDLGDLTNEQLATNASAWRKRALRGDRAARAIAHKLEKELRSRVGLPITNASELDLRPQSMRQPHRSWWRFW
jgi:hypothetical protein